MSLPPMYSTYCTYHKLPTTKSPPQKNHCCLINTPPNWLQAQPFASPSYRESNAKIIKSKLQELTEGCSEAWRQWQQCMVMITCHTLNKKAAVWAPASRRGLPTSTNTMTMPTNVNLYHVVTIPRLLAACHYLPCIVPTVYTINYLPPNLNPRRITSAWSILVQIDSKHNPSLILDTESPMQK